MGGGVPPGLSKVLSLLAAHTHMAYKLEYLPRAVHEVFKFDLEQLRTLPFNLASNLWDTALRLLSGDTNFPDNFHAQVGEHFDFQPICPSHMISPSWRVHMAQKVFFGLSLRHFSRYIT